MNEYKVIIIQIISRIVTRQLTMSYW